VEKSQATIPPEYSERHTTRFVSTSFANIGAIGIPSPADILPGDVNNDKDFDHLILSSLGSGVRMIEGNRTGIYNPFQLAIDLPIPNGSGAVEMAFANIDGDGTIAVNDLLAIIAGWGGVDPNLDLDGSGVVDVGDLLVIIAGWGAC
jgi:hypothetical protein